MSRIKDILLLIMGAMILMSGHYIYNDLVYVDDNNMMQKGEYCAQFHRIDDINTATTTWDSVKFDTLVASESTTGFDFTNDSTYFLTGFDGIVRVQGCFHTDWNGGNGVTAQALMRVTVNSVEARCLQANRNRSRNTNDNDIIPITGTIFVNSGDTIRVWYKVSSADMDFEGFTDFDNPVAVSVNFEYISEDL